MSESRLEFSIGALRKKATTDLTVYQQKPQAKQKVESPAAAEKYKTETIFARSTSYSHDESERDGGTELFKSGTQVPLTYLKEGKIGTAAVAGIYGIKFGDLIITPDGRRYLAVDTGSALKKKKASQKLADARKKKHPEYNSSRYRDAEVIDFFSEGNKQVCGEWDTFTVIHNPKDFMSLKVSERKTYLEPKKWEAAIAQLTVKSPVLIASD